MSREKKGPDPPATQWDRKNGSVGRRVTRGITTSCGGPLTVDNDDEDHWIGS